MPEERTPDSYFADIPEPLRTVAADLRSMILGMDRDLREVIKWGSPVYERNKPVIWIKAQKKHLTCGFFRGAELADPEGLLEGTGKSMRHVKVRASGMATRGPMRNLVKAALQLDG